jgi:hypothetical protein
MRREKGNAMWARLARGMRPKPSMVIIVVCVALGVWGEWKSGQIRIGDTAAGVPELRAGSRYNQDTAVITSKFSIGVDVISAVVETVANGCIDHEVVSLMDQFEGAIQGRARSAVGHLTPRDGEDRQFRLQRRLAEMAHPAARPAGAGAGRFAD